MPEITNRLATKNQGEGPADPLIKVSDLMLYSSTKIGSYYSGSDGSVKDYPYTTVSTNFSHPHVRSRRIPTIPCEP